MVLSESSAHGSLVIHSAKIASAGILVNDGWVLIQEGTVTGRGTGREWPSAERIIDATAEAGPGALLTPGFIDIHCHGGGGEAFDDGVDAIRTARALHRSHGTTRAVVSLVTAPLDRLTTAVAVVADLAETDQDVLGSHLEGPFLDPGHKGAHDAALLREPTAEAVRSLMEAGRGSIRQVTFAPELPGALDAIRTVVQYGVAAAIGHTDADDDTVRAAFDAGATILTHAFNAMRPLHHRDPGPVLVAAADHRVTLEAIADTVHLHPQVLRLLFDEAPARIALVTDAMAAAGSGDGDYELGSLHVHVRDGIARIEDGSIAGSTLTQDAALRHAVDAGVAVEVAVHALTGVPARAIGRHDHLGSLDPGHAGDAVLLDAGLRVVRVWTGGPVGHGGSETSRAGRSSFPIRDDLPATS